MKSKQSQQSPTDTAIEWMVRLQSPELTELEERQFFAWLEASEEHQRAYIAAEKLSERADVVQALAASNEASVVQATASRRSWYPQAIAASVVLFVTVALVQFWGVWDIETYRSVVGERRQIVLSDGSTVILNTHSQLRVKKMQSGEPRLVYLDRGEAFFDVASDNGRAFLVETAQGAVKVLGTQFTVHTVAQDTWVTVLEGKVAIADSSADALASQTGEQDAVLVADQQLSVVQAAKGISPESVDAVALTSWQQGKLVYNGVSFEVVVKDLSRYFEGELRLGADALKSVKMVAVLEITDKASTIAALETAFNVVAVQRSDDVTMLYPKK
jgi:transmembrane sensor